MNLSEFEQHYRDAIERILSDLQTITLRLVELERQTLSVGQSVQNISNLVEDFIESQRRE